MAHPGNVSACRMPADLSYQTQAPLVKLRKTLHIKPVKLDASAEAPFHGNTGGSVLKLKSGLTTATATPRGVRCQREGIKTDTCIFAKIPLKRYG